jgi:hypothetical protein
MGMDGDNLLCLLVETTNFFAKNERKNRLYEMAMGMANTNPSILV